MQEHKNTAYFSLIGRVIPTRYVMYYHPHLYPLTAHENVKKARILIPNDLNILFKIVFMLSP